MKKPHRKNRGWRARKSALTLLACAAALSERVESQVRLADIVYANDQSGSMSLRYIWISPDRADTLYLNSTSGCPAGFYTTMDLNGFGQVTVPHQSGTRYVNLINPAKSPAACTSHLSGDPFSQRAIVLQGAIDFQAIRAPESRAGYLGFSGGLYGVTAPRPLDSPANLVFIKNNISILNSGATNYLIALDQAKKWLTNPLLSPNPAKAVIFLSDGQPNTPDSTSYLDVLSSTYAAAPGTMPHIYGIFMGNPRPDTARLHELSQLTGGQFFLVPPQRPDSLRAVMERIIGIILNPDPSTSTKKTHKSVIPKPTANLTSFTRHSDGTLLINLSQHVAHKGNEPASHTWLPGQKFMPFVSVYADILGRNRSPEKPVFTKKHAPAL